MVLGIVKVPIVPQTMKNYIQMQLQEHSNASRFVKLANIEIHQMVFAATATVNASRALAQEI
jgi:hypothetical protein